MNSEKCDSRYHNTYAADYDGRLVVTRKFDGGHVEKCVVCGSVYWVRYSRKLGSNGTCEKGGGINKKDKCAEYVIGIVDNVVERYKRQMEDENGLG